MKGEITAIIEKSPDGGYRAYSPEIPGANGQGETVEEAVSLIMTDWLEDSMRGMPDDIIKATIAL